mgnify:CR=1 FL=1
MGMPVFIDWRFSLASWRRCSCFAVRTDSDCCFCFPVGEVLLLGLELPAEEFVIEADEDVFFNVPPSALIALRGDPAG